MSGGPGREAGGLGALGARRAAQRPLGGHSSSPAPPFPLPPRPAPRPRASPPGTGALTSAATARGDRPRSAIGIIYAWFEFNRPCRERILADPGTGQYVGAMHKAFVSCNIEHSPATTALRMVAYSLLYTGAMLMVVSKRNRDKFRRYTQFLMAWAAVQLVVLVLATRAYQSCTHPGNCVMIPGLINSNWWMFIVAPVGLPIAMWFVYVEEGRSLALLGYMMVFFVTQAAAFQGEKSLIPLVVKKESTIGEQLLVRLVLHPFLWETTLFLGRFCIRQLRNFNYDVGCTYLGVLHAFYSLYGRFLLLQLRGAGEMIMINLALGIVGLFVRALFAAFDEFMLKAQHGPRPTAAYIATVQEAKLRAHESYAQSVAEFPSIVVASFFSVLVKVKASPTDAINMNRVATEVILQVLMLLAFDYASLKVDFYFHGIKHRKVWAERSPGYRLFLGAFVLFFIVDSVLGLLANFCPEKVDGGLVMTYCDEASMLGILNGRF